MVCRKDCWKEGCSSLVLDSPRWRSRGYDICVLGSVFYSVSLAPWQGPLLRGTLVGSLLLSGTILKSRYGGSLSPGTVVTILLTVNWLNHGSND